MKKIFLLLTIITMLAGGITSSCTRANPKCKQSHKRIKDMRKNNPNFKM
jgi:hypothetical protein